jgi:hypothetical protein
MKEKYIPGEGCECSARCSCECGCDVDWTPREVYELREQRDETSHNLASIVAAILKRDGRDVFDMSATDRLAELHTAERQRDEAVNNYETAVLREHRMQEQRDRLAEALRSIRGYWNRNQNESAMVDACWHAIYTAEQALAAVKGGSDEISNS